MQGSIHNPSCLEREKREREGEILQRWNVKWGCEYRAETLRSFIALLMDYSYFIYINSKVPFSWKPDDDGSFIRHVSNTVSFQTRLESWQGNSRGDHISFQCFHHHSRPISTHTYLGYRRKYKTYLNHTIQGLQVLFWSAQASSTFHPVRRDWLWTSQRAWLTTWKPRQPAVSRYVPLARALLTTLTTLVAKTQEGETRHELYLPVTSSCQRRRKIQPGCTWTKLHFEHHQNAAHHTPSTCA